MILLDLSISFTICLELPVAFRKFLTLNLLRTVSTSKQLELHTMDIMIHERCSCFIL